MNWKESCTAILLIGCAFFLVLLSMISIRHMTGTYRLCDLPTIHLSDFLARAQTGDLVLAMSMESMGLPVWDRVWQHAGIVWRHPKWGPCIAEYVDKNAPEPIETDGILGRSFRIVKLSTYLANPKRILGWRPLVKCPPLIRESFSETVATVANRDYNASLNQKDAVIFVSMGLAAVWPSFAKWLSEIRGINHGDSTYCSRFVLELYREAGILDTDAMQREGLYVEVASPTLFLESMGTLDRCVVPGVSFGRETLVLPYNVA